MKREEEIKDKYGTDGGWTVPDGYFESFYEKMEARLPEYPEKPREVSLTLWQRMKPYVYLAAMFAGIWVMMKVFYNVSSEASFQVDNPPHHIAMAMQELSTNDSYVDVEGYNYGSTEAVEEVIYEYDNITDLEKDLGFELDPEYKNIDIEEITEEN